MNPEAALEELEHYVMRLLSENLALQREKEALLRQLEAQTQLNHQLLSQQVQLGDTSSALHASSPLATDGNAVVLSASERLYFKERLTHLLELITLELHRLDA